jgi:hypothetical protein
MVALVALVWAVFVPDGLFWTAVLAAGLIGSAVATAAVVRSRSIPTLAQVIEAAQAEPRVVPARRSDTGGGRVGPSGERRP